MSYSADALAVLIVLLPGFLCAKIVQWLCVRPTLTETDKVIEALIFSFVTYSIFFLIFGKIDLSRRLHWLVLVALPVLLALAFSSLSNTDTVGEFLRKLRLTNRTSRPSVWHDAFDKFRGYVLIELEDRRTLLGWVEYYSDFPNEPSLFLSDAAWIEEGGARRQIEGPGILVTSACGIRTIGFYNATVNAQEGDDKAKKAPAAANSCQYTDPPSGC